MRRTRRATRTSRARTTNVCRPERPAVPGRPPLPEPTLTAPRTAPFTPERRAQFLALLTDMIVSYRQEQHLERAHAAAGQAEADPPMEPLGHSLAPCDQRVRMPQPRLHGISLGATPKPYGALVAPGDPVARAVGLVSASSPLPVRRRSGMALGSVLTRRSVGRQQRDAVEQTPALPAVSRLEVLLSATRSAAICRLNSLRSVDSARDSVPSILTQLPGPVLVDEWQRLPEVWDQVRRAVDAGSPPGHFIIAGSSAPRGAVIHSGAGRLVPMRMRPLSVAERAIESPTVSLAALLAGNRDIGGTTHIRLPDYVEEITASGFPARDPGTTPAGTPGRVGRVPG
jgi:hypothetical protein